MHRPKRYLLLLLLISLMLPTCPDPVLVGSEIDEEALEQATWCVLSLRIEGPKPRC